MNAALLMMSCKTLDWILYHPVWYRLLRTVTLSNVQLAVSECSSFSYHSLQGRVSGPHIRTCVLHGLFFPRLDMFFFFFIFDNLFAIEF